MKSYCDYHPLEPGKWLCPQCQTFYCRQCSPGKRPDCPVCKISMENLGSSNEIEPFWNRIPDLFRYPFKGQSLILVVFITALSMLITESIGGAVVLVGLLMLTTLYGFTVLRSTAAGSLSPPGLIEMFSNNLMLILKQILWFSGFGLLCASGFLHSTGLGIITLCFGILMYPASGIIFVHESSILSAINPFRLIDFVRRTGSGYFILYIHIILISMASGAVEGVVEEFQWSTLSIPIFSFVNCVGMIMMYYLMGYFLLQYQRELGFIVELDDDSSTNFVEDPLGKAKLWVKMGDYVNGISAVEAARRINPESETLKNYYWDLLLQTKHYDKLIPYSDLVCLRYIDSVRFDELKPFIQYALTARSNGFELLSTRITLAKAFLSKSDIKWSYGVLKDIHKQYEYDPSLAEGLTLLANTLIQLKQLNNAKKVLQYAIKIAPDDLKENIKKQYEILVHSGG